MSKAEDYIRKNTNQLSNEDGFDYIPWLTPDQALKAVEIAREEMMERACDAYCKVCGHYPHTVPTYICRQKCDYYDDFKQAIKDE